MTEHPAPLPPAPPRPEGRTTAPMTDERLAEIGVALRAMQFGTEWRLVRELHTEVTRLRASVESGAKDGELGRALREALATVPVGARLNVWPDMRAVEVSPWDGDDYPTEAGNRLAAALGEHRETGP